MSVQLFLLQAVPIPDKLINATDSFFGKFFSINQPDSKDVINFYNAWSSVLDPGMALLVRTKQLIWSAIAKGTYDLTHSVENAFNGSFKLLGVVGNIGDSKTVLGQLHTAIFTLSFILLTIALGFLAFQMITGKQAALHQMTRSLITAIFVIGILPTIIGWGGQLVTSSINDINGGSGSQTKVASVALQPFRDNVVNVLQLDLDNFNTDPEKIGGKEGYAKYNSLTDKNLKSTDFTAVVTQDVVESAKDIGDAGKVFDYQRVQGFTDKNGNDQFAISSVKPPENVQKISKAMSEVYPVYYAHWFMIIAQELVLAVIFIAVTVKAVTSIFNIVTLTIIAPLIAFSEVKTSKKLKELLSAIEGSLMALIMEVIAIKVFVIFIDYLPASGALDATGVSGNPIATTILRIAVYIGGFFGVFNGISMIEKWTGVSAGYNDQVAHAMPFALAGGMAAGALGRMGAGGVKRALSASRRSGSSLTGKGGGKGGGTGGGSGTSDSPGGTGSTSTQGGAGGLSRSDTHKATNGVVNSTNGASADGSKGTQSDGTAVDSGTETGEKDLGAASTDMSDNEDGNANGPGTDDLSDVASDTSEDTPGESSAITDDGTSGIVDADATDDEPDFSADTNDSGSGVDDETESNPEVSSAIRSDSVGGITGTSPSTSTTSTTADATTTGNDSAGKSSVWNWSAMAGSDSPTASNAGSGSSSSSNLGPSRAGSVTQPAVNGVNGSGNAIDGSSANGTGGSSDVGAGNHRSTSGTLSSGNLTNSTNNGVSQGTPQSNSVLNGVTNPSTATANSVNQRPFTASDFSKQLDKKLDAHQRTQQAAQAKMGRRSQSQMRRQNMMSRMQQSQGSGQGTVHGVDVRDDDQDQ